jgi:hypothetical protein
MRVYISYNSNSLIALERSSELEKRLSSRV